MDEPTPSSGDAILNELLKDQRFIQWIQFPTDYDQPEWTKKAEENPDFLWLVNDIRSILGNLHYKQDWLEEESKNRIWENLSLLFDQRFT